MHRFIAWETDLETGARSIAEMIEIFDIRKAWKRIYSDARSISGKYWHIGLWKEGESCREIKNEQVLPVGNQMRIRYHTREIKRLEIAIHELQVEKRKHAVEVAELGGPEYF
jgi:hypothetical protein